MRVTVSITKHRRWGVCDIQSGNKPWYLVQERTTSRGKIFYMAVQSKCISRFWDQWTCTFSMCLCVGELSVWMEIIVHEMNNFLEAILTHFLPSMYWLSVHVFWLRVPSWPSCFSWNSASVLTLHFSHGLISSPFLEFTGSQAEF